MGRLITVNRYGRLGGPRRSRSASRRWLTVFLGIAILIAVVKTWTLLTGRTNPVDHGINTLATPLVLAVRYTGEGLGSLGQVFRLPTLLRENRRLKSENELLTRQLSETEMLRATNEQLRAALKLKHSDFRAVNAMVIARPYDLWLDQVMINAGTSDGIVEGDIVVNPAGVVGVVDKNPSADACWVTLVTSPRFWLAAVSSDSQCEGVIHGLEGNNPLRSLRERAGGEGPDLGSMELKHLKSSAPVAIGEKVFTSGVTGSDEAGQHRPRGLLIGTVRHRNSDPNGFLDVRVEPAVDASRINTVTVLVQ